MASIINIDFSQFKDDLNATKEKLSDKEALFRPVCVELSGLMHDRIHEEGKASDGSQIGTYSPEYMKIRTGDYLNSKRFAKGAKKGKLKDAGVVTKRRIATPFGKSAFAIQNIESEGIKRERYNLPNDTKVILVLTRKLSNSWGAFATDRGYGVGFTDDAATKGVTGAKKIQYAEEHFGKKIGEMTKEENEYAFERLNELSTEIIGRT